MINEDSSVDEIRKKFTSTSLTSLKGSRIAMTIAKKIVSIAKDPEKRENSEINDIFYEINKIIRNISVASGVFPETINVKI